MAGSQQPAAASETRPAAPLPGSGDSPSAEEAGTQPNRQASTSGHGFRMLPLNAPSSGQQRADTAPPPQHAHIVSDTGSVESIVSATVYHASARRSSLVTTLGLGSRQSSFGQQRPALCVELVDHVLDYLQPDEPDDREALFECTLVCKLWADLAARHLFASFRLNPIPLVSTASGLVPAHFAIRQHPRVTQNVRNLEVTQVNYDYSIGRWSAGWNLTTWSGLTNKDEPKLDTLPLVLITDIIATFPQLRSLWFRNIVIGGALPEGISESALSLARIAAPIALRELRVDGNDDANYLLPLRELLDMFVVAKTLHLNGYFMTAGSWNRSRGAVLDSYDSAPRTKVEHLVLDCSLNAIPVDQVCLMLANAADTSGLRSLSLITYEVRTGEGSSDVRVLNTFICNHASILDTCTLDIGIHHALFDGIRPGDPIREGLDFDFSCCPNLHTFHLTLWLNYWPLDLWLEPLEHLRLQNECIWEPALRALLTIPHDSLTRLTIGINFVPESHHVHIVPGEAERLSQCLCTLNWQLLKGVMDHHRTLEALEIQFSEDLKWLWLPEVQDAVWQKLPKSVACKTKFSDSSELSYLMEPCHR